MRNFFYVLIAVLFFSCSKEGKETPKEVEYRVTNTNASHVYVSYHNEDERLWGFQDSKNWSAKVMLKRRPFHALLRGTAIAKENSVATLTLEIYVDGKLVKSETKSGQDPSIEMEYIVN